MGLFSRKPSYEEQVEQERLATERQEEERQKYVDDHVTPWIEALAVNRNGDSRLSDELLEKVGDLPSPPRPEDREWFSSGAEKLVRSRRNMANIDATFAEAKPDHDVDQVRRWRMEQEFWMSVDNHLSTKDILGR